MKQTLDCKNARGAVLVEFALVALVFYLLFAAAVTFGQAIFYAQVLQDAARVAAREMALVPLPADATFEEALAQVFDEEALVINLDDLGGMTLDEHFDSLPVVNRALRPLMIPQEAGGQRLLRYPGALMEDPTTATGFRVALPLVRGRDADGVETVDWVPVIEEIVSPGAAVRPFALEGGGVVAVRANCPYQSPLMSGFLPNPAGPAEPTLGSRIQAEDGAVTVVDEDGFSPPPSASPFDGGEDAGTYSGPFGLGRQLAFAQRVRPFRKFLSAQAIYRREIFS